WIESRQVRLRVRSPRRGGKSNRRGRGAGTSGTSFERKGGRVRVQNRKYARSRCRKRIGKRMRRTVVGKRRQEHAARDSAAIREDFVAGTVRIAAGPLHAGHAQRIAEGVEHRSGRRSSGCVSPDKRLHEKHESRDERDDRASALLPDAFQESSL